MKKTGKFSQNVFFLLFLIGDKLCWKDQDITKPIEIQHSCFVTLYNSLILSYFLYCFGIVVAGFHID